MAIQNVEWKDVQGIVLSGYGTHPRSVFLMLKITEPDAAKNWLGRLLESGAVMDAERIQRRDGEETAAFLSRLPKHLVNIALTQQGLAALEVDEASLASFPAEMQEGMTGTDRRRSMLGDVGEDAPENWEWGDENSTPDILIMIYGADTKDLENRTETTWNLADIEEILGGFEGVKYLTKPAAKNKYDKTPVINCHCRDDRREHFGFRDGISQPHIEGTRAAEGRRYGPNEVSIVKAGEMVLGYKNERGLYPVSPTVGPDFDRNNHLKAKDGRKDIGRNGTYLVFRQLSQDVEAFENFLTEATPENPKPDRPDDTTLVENPRERVAARMMGRWRNGAPLVRYPHSDPKLEETEAGTIWDKQNQFLYHFEDPKGIKCPIGAHIRRANPRDSLEPDPETALRLSKRRRIMRRGRLYGPHTMDGKEAAGRKPRRGLMFVCLNADIAGQFELVQHSWMNNIHFADLYDERDPIGGLGMREGETMTFQESPVNKRTPPLKKFVSVRGGAYFFLPGLSALRCLADSGKK